MVINMNKITRRDFLKFAGDDYIKRRELGK
jgi:hypothetical protein